MAEYTKRVQAVLTEEQFSALSKLSAGSGKPISVLIREAVEQVYLAGTSRERRQAALARLVSLDAPVSEWDQMEEEITRGATV
jgi:hypothetical protein